MTRETADALYRYFETLYALNQKLITLCGIDVIDNRGQYEGLLEGIIHSTPRLVPYIVAKGTNNCKISSGDGLLEFSQELPFLKEEYNALIQSHMHFLRKAKTTRNKLEHKMHCVATTRASSGSDMLFSVAYVVGNTEVKFDSEEIISFMKDINVLFSKIQKQVEVFVTKDQLNDHPFFRRLIRFDFLEFNKIYNCDLLRTIGKALLPF